MDEKDLIAKLEVDFEHCPFCGSADIDAGDRDGERVIEIQIVCDSCGGTWIEYYRYFDAGDFRAPTGGRRNA